MKFRKKTGVKEGRMFYALNTALLLLFTLIIIIPIWNVVVTSISLEQSTDGSLMLWPRGVSFENYRRVFNNDAVVNAFMVSVARTVIGATSHVLFCAIMAYALSKKHLIGRNIYTRMGVLTMYVGGGMIPTYLLIRSLGLLNSFWVYIIPGLLSYYDVVILMNFFRDIPVSLEEAARIDGANDWKIFFKIYLPLSKPVLATVMLFSAVGHWNDFMTTKLYITNRALYPLQMLVYNIVVESQLSSLDYVGGMVETSARGVQLATIIVTTIPILLAYPLLQKYFISGMMQGAVKE